MKKFKALGLFALGLVLAGAFMLSSSLSAEATVSGGAGAGGGGGSSPNVGFPWTRISIAQYNTGAGLPYWSGVDSSVCRDSRAEIWAKVSDGTSGYPVGTFGWSQTHAVGFSNLPASFQAWANGRTFVNVICGYNKERKSRTLTDTRNNGNSDQRTFDYSWTTTVTPEVVDATGRDLIGVNNLNTQTDTVISDFGNVYNTIASSGTGSSNAKFSQIDAAIASSANNQHGQVDLNADNVAGLAEGGVLSIIEHTRQATISISQSWRDTRSRTETCDFDAGTWSNPTNCTYSSWSSWSEIPGSRTHTVSKSQATQQATSFWQILSVHCNPNELNGLLGEVPTAQLISQATGVDGNSTSVVYSQRYSSRPARVDFGFNNGDGSFRSLSGTVGFYDKECDITCVANPSAGGASTANGGTTNIGSANPAPGRGFLTGAWVASTNANTNFAEVFRDNENRRVTVDTWWPRVNDPQYNYGQTTTNPVTGATVNVPASAPISTTITRWADGTPSAAAGSGGQFSLFAVNGAGAQTKLFTGDADSTPATQRNFGTDPYQSVNSTTLTGLYRTFDFKATWASELDRPQVINVKWEYQPRVWTQFPGRIGFSNNRGIHQSQTTAALTPVDGRCYAQYGTTDRKLDLLQRVQASTGSGTTNTLDSGLVEEARGDSSWEVNSNLVFKFVRAVSE